MEVRQRTAILQPTGSFLNGSRLPYLQELTLRLALGASQLPSEQKALHGDWLVRQQRDDGGFSGREGESDPYYTAFALRSLWILDRLDTSIASGAGEFLRGRMRHRESIIDLISLIFGAAICELAAGVSVIDDDDHSWRSNVGALLGQLRCDDGGFAKTPEGRAGSTYQTFLSVLCYELMDLEPPQTDNIIRFLQSQAHPDGGYLEIRAAKRAGVNPTAAAIGTLKALGRLDPEEHANTAAFIADQQSDEGGFTANTRIPFADLLSTCTGLITLSDLSRSPAGPDEWVQLAAIRSYAHSMQASDGGFHGFALDQTADVEYSFYGIATLSLLALADSDSSVNS